jgi:hypothetical protein
MIFEIGAGTKVPFRFYPHLAHLVFVRNGARVGKSALAEKPLADSLAVDPGSVRAAE